MQTARMQTAIKNDEWITPEDIKDPDILPRVPGHFILVRPVSVKTETKGGIILPDSTKNDISYLTTVGKVLLIGAAAYKDEERYPNGPWCEVGDYVTYGKTQGQKFFYKGVNVLLLFEDQITMIVDDPKTLDLTYNLSN